MIIIKSAAFLAALIASLGIYSTTGTVTEIDREADTVTFTTSMGIMYAFRGCEDWASNDLVSATMWDAGTPDVTDDVILWARYSGTADMLPDAFPRRREFDAEFGRDFPKRSYDLYGQTEFTRDVLVSRKNRETYTVEVVTGTVLDSDGNGKLDKGAPYDYISYAGLGFPAGSRVVTYFVYALHSDEADDIAMRYDYRIDR